MDRRDLVPLKERNVPSLSWGGGGIFSVLTGSLRPHYSHFSCYRQQLSCTNDARRSSACWVLVYSPPPPPTLWGPTSLMHV